jgi:hypothetical protein
VERVELVFRPEGVIGTYMLETNSIEVVQALGAAKNLNAALKSFLKKQGSSAKAMEPFVKELRSVVQTAKNEILTTFVEKNLQRKEQYFVALVPFAFPEAVNGIVEQVISKYADGFNSTYQKGEDGVEITDHEKFAEIVSIVMSEIDSGLTAGGLAPSNFLRNALVATIFEPDLLPIVFEKLDL